MNVGVVLSIGVIAVGTSLWAVGWERPPMDTVQRGYRGVGMEHVANPRTLEVSLAANQVPEPIEPVENGGTLSKDLYENVQVLGDLDSEQFNRLMSAITEWVSPEQGCAYCHNVENMAEDNLYTKVVSRRMLQMTQHINSQWKTHVGGAGVTCYTCHRGNNVPANIWFKDPGQAHASNMLGGFAGQNMPAPKSGLASLPFDPFTPFLQGDRNIRVVGKDALPVNSHQSIKQAEWTYGLMMHMSTSLGVNCTYCHNSRNFSSWDQSNPARGVAWYGIRMVRDLNNAYLQPLGPVYPPHRLSAAGDAPKTNCTTCHQGAYKPLYGAQMLKDYPELAGPGQPAPVAQSAATQ